MFIFPVALAVVLSPYQVEIQVVSWHRILGIISLCPESPQELLSVLTSKSSDISRHCLHVTWKDCPWKKPPAWSSGTSDLRNSLGKLSHNKTTTRTGRISSLNMTEKSKSSGRHVKSESISHSVVSNL